MNIYNHKYIKLAERWEYVSDCYNGASRIKSPDRAERYLPPLRRERAEAELYDGRSPHYDLRKAMAAYENFFRPVIDDIVGLMQKNEPNIKFGLVEDTESPDEVRAIRWYGNRYNDGLAGLKQRLNFHQVLYGRYGLLLDIVTDQNGYNPQFSITEYPPFKILDGETDGARFKWALLDESTTRFNPETKTHDRITRRRVLGIDRNGRYYQSVIESPLTAELDEWLSFDLLNPPPEKTTYPVYKGIYLDFVPFTVCNVNRLGYDEWQNPPYEDVARVAINNYQIDSIYKQALLNHATPTLVITNAAKETNEIYLGGVIWAKGAGAFPVQVNLLETTGDGIAEMREAKNAGKETLRYTSIRDLLDRAGANTTGEAIKLRTATGTAAIAAIDTAGAMAIEEQLVFASEWAGATHAEAMERIEYRADTSYLGAEVQLPSVVSLLALNQETKTLSNEALYRLLDRSVPGVLPTYADNEYQKNQDARSAVTNQPQREPES